MEEELVYAPLERVRQVIDELEQRAQAAHDQGHAVRECCESGGTQPDVAVGAYLRGVEVACDDAARMLRVLFGVNEETPGKDW